MAWVAAVLFPFGEIKQVRKWATDSVNECAWGEQKWGEVGRSKQEGVESGGEKDRSLHVFFWKHLLRRQANRLTALKEAALLKEHSLHAREIARHKRVAYL